ncbi:hypothetical protein [Microbacterium sp.]|uniref:hypothetical protein n=1 Tax=Microbacterium sp. TaxID=51671 RepID=UPI0033429CB6
MSKTRLLPLALVGTIAVLVSGCTAVEQTEEDPAAWASRQDHVSSAELIPYDDGDGDGDASLSVVLDEGLDDETVHAVVDAFKAHFDGTTGAPSIEVDVDGFRGHVFPAKVGDDPELRRALWLRADGRATSYGDRYRSKAVSHPVVTAPAAVVAQLALDYDDAVPHDGEVRYTMSVESADGTAGVQWDSSVSLGFGIDEEAVGSLAALQERYPGTTGWIDTVGTETTGAVHFSSADVTLDAVAAGGLVDPKPFVRLELGWGPARGDAPTFAGAFSDPAVRAALQAVSAIDGVTELRSEAPGSGRAVSVTVDSVAAFEGVRGYAARSGTHLTVRLLRAPVLFNRFADPVFSVRTDAPPARLDAFRTVVDLPGIRALKLSEKTGYLVVDGDATDRELEATFASLLRLPGPYASTVVAVAVPRPYGADAESALGTLARGTGAVLTVDDPVHDDLVARISAAWTTAAG